MQIKLGRSFADLTFCIILTYFDCPKLAAVAAAGSAIELQKGFLKYGKGYVGCNRYPVK